MIAVPFGVFASTERDFAHQEGKSEHAEDKVEEDGDEEDIDEVRDRGKDRIYDKLHALVFGHELEWA